MGRFYTVLYIYCSKKNQKAVKYFTRSVGSHHISPCDVLFLTCLQMKIAACLQTQVYDSAHTVFSSYRAVLL